jgi:type I restriction enzyme, S subunit
MSDFASASIADCLDRFSSGAAAKLTTDKYRGQGAYPVIDQGQSFIAGWTDDDSGLISDGLPLVVFGDHTRAFKYVDFPFVRGADGTQILKPKAGIDPQFFYYACRAVSLPSRGYNRHFKELKESRIALPDFDEQKLVGRCLRHVDHSITMQAKKLAAHEELKRATMRELFTRGLRGEARKDSEIGLVPESWEVSRLGNHILVGSGGTPSRSVARFWSDGNIPWVKTTEVKYNTIRETEEFITAEGLANSAAKKLPVGTLLMAMYGQGVTRGKVATLGIEATCNQACATMNRRDEGGIDTRYLFHFLTYRYEEIRGMAHGGQQQNLNLDIVRDLPVAFPQDEHEQDEITAILDAIDAKVDLHKRKKAVLEELFRGLLHKLMTGEIRVADLDLSALDKLEEATT